MLCAVHAGVRPVVCYSSVVALIYLLQMYPLKTQFYGKLQILVSLKFSSYYNTVVNFNQKNWLIIFWTIE